MPDDKPKKRSSRLLRRGDPRPGDKVELPPRPAPPASEEPKKPVNQITVAGLTVELVDRGHGEVDLLFRCTEDIRVKGGRMGRMPVPARFKVKGGVIVTLNIEKV